MNKLAYTVFVAFCASIATLLAVAALADDNNGNGDEEDMPLISKEELAEHDHPESCWKAIDGKVYDVTDYIPDHPTPESVMHEWCGKESTEPWETKGYGRPHSQEAEEMLKDMLVGRLEKED